MGFRKARAYERSFKLAALERLAAGESVSGVARALGIRRELLCEWRKRQPCSSRNRWIARRAGRVAHRRLRPRPRSGAAARRVERGGDVCAARGQPGRLL